PGSAMTDARSSLAPATRTPTFASRFLRHRLAVAGVVVLALIGIAVVLGPLVLPHHPDAIAMADRDQPPSASHLFGTDELGRDQLARVLDGGRLTLSVAIAAVAFSLVVGVAVGALAAHMGGI